MAAGKYRPFDEMTEWKIDYRSYGLHVVDEDGRTICSVDQRDSGHPATNGEGHAIAKQIASFPRLRLSVIHLLLCMEQLPPLSPEVCKAKSAVEEALDADGEKAGFLRSRGWHRIASGLWEEAGGDSSPITFREAYWQAVQDKAKEPHDAASPA